VARVSTGRRIDPCRQFAEREWLCEIVIAARLEAANPVIDCAKSAQYEDRRAHRFRTEGLNDSEPL
jgi:hypothetical protein